MTYIFCVIKQKTNLMQLINDLSFVTALCPRPFAYNQLYSQNNIVYGCRRVVVEHTASELFVQTIQKKFFHTKAVYDFFMDTSRNPDNRHLPCFDDSRENFRFLDVPLYRYGAAGWVGTQLAGLAPRSGQ